MIGKSDVVIITVAIALIVLAGTRLYSSELETNRVVQAPDWQLGDTSTLPSNMTADTTSTRVFNTASPLDAIASTTTAVQETTSDEVDNFTQPAVIKEASFKSHVVQSGEYLSIIAQKYNTTVAELQSLNDLKGTTIYVGQKLVYPDP